MELFRSLGISASGLTAQRIRMDVIANNIANATTTRDAEGSRIGEGSGLCEVRGNLGVRPQVCVAESDRVAFSMFITRSSDADKNVYCLSILSSETV